MIFYGYEGYNWIYIGKLMKRVIIRKQRLLLICKALEVAVHYKVIKCIELM